MSVEASEQQPTVEMDERTAASNPPITFEDPVGELSSRVMVVQSLINLKEVPEAIDVEEEPEVTINPTIV